MPALRSAISLPACLVCAPLIATSALAQAPVITDVDHVTTTPGRFIVVQGSSFGSAEGDLLFGESPGIVSTWTGAEIRAWVPADAPLGAIDLVVVDADGDVSAPVALEVGPRERNGRVLWRVALDSSEPSLHAPATASDGTVYIDDSHGTLYAVDPDGDLRWIYRGGPIGQGGANEGPIAVGDDGRVYWAYNPLGLSLEVHAVRPDGTNDWIFDAGLQGGVPYVFVAGPSLGPDGNLYVSTDRAWTGALGMFSLTPGGEFRWNNQGDPFIDDAGALGRPIAFAGDVAAMNLNGGDTNPAPFTWAFDLDGTQRFTLSPTNSSANVHAGPDGSFTVRWSVSGSTRRYDDQGTLLWSHSTGPLFYFSDPVVASDGSTFFALGGGAQLRKVNPDGTTAYSIADPSHGVMNFLGVTPDARTVIDGGREGFGVPGWITAYDAEDGARLWRVDLPEEAGSDLVVQSKPGFSPDGRVAYFSVNRLGGDDDRSYLYAIELEAAPSIVGDLDGNGVVDGADLAALLAAWGTSDAAADLDGDGSVGGADLALLLAAWAP